MAENTAIEGISFPVLVGDIGGTNVRFALIAGPDAAMQPLRPVATADFPDMETAIEACLAGTSARPGSALIDMAGPVVGEEMVLTNAKWVIRPRETLRRCGIGEMILFNDFEALALALPALERADLVTIGPEMPTASGAKVVLGPGTGLGVGALVEAGGRWVPAPGEGGHVSLGPAEADEFPLWAHIEPEFGRITAEVILCGRGLVQLYRAVSAADGGAPVFGEPAGLTKAALDRTDPAAVKTLTLWCRLLGRFAGDLALILMARGGVYVGGGIPPRILPFLTDGGFRRAFEAKAPHAALMATIPTFLIKHETPALEGLAAFARAPERFGINLAGRRWKA